MERGTAGFQNSRWKNLGLGVTDGEAASANTQDVIMIVANSTGSIGSGDGGFAISDGYTGIGGKRSQNSGQFPSNYTWNASGGGDSKAGNILDPANHNGNIVFDTDAAILMFVAPF